MYRFFPPPAGPRWSSRRGPDDEGRGLYGVLIGCYLLGIRIVFFQNGISSSCDSAAVADGADDSVDPRGPPRNWTLSATTSILLRFTPSVSQLRCRRRPSTSTGRPLERYSAQFSAVFPNTEMSKKETSSLTSLVDFALYLEFTAMLKLVTASPEGRKRVSGSRTRLPARMTRLKVTIGTLPCPARQASAGAAGVWGVSGAGVSGAGAPESAGTSPAGGAAASTFGASSAVCSVVRWRRMPSEILMLRSTSSTTPRFPV